MGGYAMDINYAGAVLLVAIIIAFVVFSKKRR